LLHRQRLILLQDFVFIAQPGQPGTKLHHKGTKFTKKNFVFFVPRGVKIFAFLYRFNFKENITTNRSISNYFFQIPASHLYIAH